MSIPALVLAGALAALAGLRWTRLGRGQRALVVAAALVAAVYGSGVVDLPDVERAVEQVGQTLGPWTYVLVAALAFLETGAFVGLIAPGETAMVVGGVIAGQGEIDIFALLALVWAAAVSGDCVSYLLGRRLGRGFLVRHGPRVKITADRLAQVEAFFVRHGGAAILVGRFVGVVRAVAPFLAGASRMPFRRFLPYDVVGAGLWGSTFVLLGYAFWRSFDQVRAWAGRGALALGIAIAVVVGLVAAYRTLSDRGRRARLAAWLEEQAERPALRPLARVAGPAWRRAGRPVSRRLWAAGRFARDRLTPGQLGLELTTLTAIAAVGSFAFIALGVGLRERELLPFDRQAAQVADGLRADVGVDGVRALTDAGRPLVVSAVALLTAALAAYRRRLREAAALVAGLGLTAVTLNLTRAAIDRPRPADRLVDVQDPGFPSGHAAYSVALVAAATALSRAVPWLGGRVAVVGIAVALSAAVGLSRVYLRAHHLSDVIAGWGMAGALFALCGAAAVVVGFVRHNRSRA